MYIYTFSIIYVYNYSFIQYKCNNKFKIYLTVGRRQQTKKLKFVLYVYKTVLLKKGV